MEEMAHCLFTLDMNQEALAIRLYISSLTLIFLLVVLMTRDIGVLEAIVVVCPPLYLILDIREELQTLKLLEARVSSFSTNQLRENSQQ